MFIGQSQSGKTSLKRSLKGEDFNPGEISTIGIETDPSYGKVSTEVWKMANGHSPMKNTQLNILLTASRKTMYLVTTICRMEVHLP